MSQVDDFFNTTPPLKNSAAMKCIYVALADHTSRSADLATIFRNLEGEQLLWVTADGAKLYVSMGMSAGTISELATGSGETVCYPIPDGTSLPMKPIGGREVATGIATYVFYKTLHYMTGATGVTSYLRVYRTVGKGRDSQELKAPY